MHHRSKCFVFLLLFHLFIFSAGCKQSEREAGHSLIQTADPSPVTVKNESNNKVKQIKETVLSFPAIYDVAVLKGKKEVLVVYKVKQLQRFRMKQIKKKMERRLKENFPKEKFVTSSDYKIFLEVIRLHEKMDDSSYSEKKANKRFEKIIRLSKELT